LDRQQLIARPALVQVELRGRRGPTRAVCRLPE
jgi:hypothetical protein